MNFKRARAAALALAIGFGLSSAALAAHELRPDRRGELLGELDFFAYCASAHGDASRAVLFSNDAFGWRCLVVEPLYTTAEIDPDLACELQYATRAAARTDDSASPYRWMCLRD